MVADCTVVPDNKLAAIGETECQISHDYETAFVDECVAHSRHPLIIHSHPFTADAWFSTDDDAVMTGSTWIHALHDRRVLFGVLTQDELRVTEVYGDSSRTSVDTTIVGSWTLDEQDRVEPATAETGQKSVEPGDDDLHDRTRRVYGADTLQELRETHVAVVGCGGIGSELVKGLAGLGVRQVTLIDMDRIEESNLPRIPQATLQDVDQYKAAVMQQWYVRNVPGAETTIITLPVEETAQYLTDLDVDIIVAGLDRIAPRVWLNEYAARHLIPYVDAGSRIDVDDDTRIQVMGTTVQSIVPGTNTGCFECVGRIDREQLRREGLPDGVLETEVDEGYIPESALTPEPAVNYLNAVAAAEAIDQMVRIVTGYKSVTGSVIYDAVSKDLVAADTRQSDQCYTCSRFVGTGDTGSVGDTGIDDNDIEELVDDIAPVPDEQETATQEYVIPETVTSFFAQNSE
ncbi:ThiF family adenylyltransferase [Natrinema salinisoli]|uniref:ThiF family adenylyltransferase n=1 Tax=Natrinema salinisoli TaxID=2878535 RepID=UPI001CEFF296|nr:ThiF family adenylyltransferase [Natrinema salinisoli]